MPAAGNSHQAPAAAQYNLPILSLKRAVEGDEGGQAKGHKGETYYAKASAAVNRLNGINGKQ